MKHSENTYCGQELEYIQPFGDIFQKTIPQHWWLFWTLSKILLISLRLFEFWHLLVNKFWRYRTIQKRTLHILYCYLLDNAHLHINIQTKKTDIQTSVGKSNFVLKVQKSHQCWGTVFCHRKLECTLKEKSQSDDPWEGLEEILCDATLIESLFSLFGPNFLHRHIKWISLAYCSQSQKLFPECVNPV